MPAHRTVILKLRAGTLSTLTMAAARLNKDVEDIVEDVLEREFAPDGRTKAERDSDRVAALSQPERSGRDEAEVDRLIQLARSNDTNA